MIEYDDNELVKRCLSGNESAFETLFVRYQKTIYNVVYHMVHNLDEAEEITQRVFVKVYNSLERFNPKYKFFSWMYRIAVNESLNGLKQKKQFDLITEDLVSQDKRPDEIYEKTEAKEKIEYALMRIHKDYRSLIILKHINGCSYDEIAEILDIPEKKVKSRLFTARNLLKEALVDMGMIHND